MTTRQAIIIALMFAALALGVLSPSLFAGEAEDKAAAWAWALKLKTATVPAGGRSPALPAPVAVAPPMVSATVQAHIRPPASVSIKAGAKVKAAPRVAAPAWPSYPIRRSWWTGCPNWRHLTGGEHARHNFDHAWLASRSNAEIQSIHSDSHEGRLKTAYIVTRGQAASKPKAKSTVSSSACPNGNCPNSSMMRRGLFGWRR